MFGGMEVWAPISGILGAILAAVQLCVLAVWRRNDKIDRRFDQLATSSNETLIKITGELGELKGALKSVQRQAHTHTPS